MGCAQNTKQRERWGEVGMFEDIFKRKNGIQKNCRLMDLLEKMKNESMKPVFWTAPLNSMYLQQKAAR